MPETTLNRVNLLPLQQRGGISRALLYTLATAAILTGLYAIGGTLLGNWLIDRSLDRYSAGLPNRTASRESIRVNPFTLVVEIAGIELRDDANRSTLTASRVRANFSAASLLERRPILSELNIDSPDIGLGSAADLTALLGRIRSSGLNRMRIEQLVLTNGQLSGGRRSDSPFELTRAELQLARFDGNGTDGRYLLTATSAAGAAIESEGTLAANLERIDGRLRIAGADAAVITGWLSPESSATGPAELTGRVTLEGDLRITHLLSSPTIEMNAENIDVSSGSLLMPAGISATFQRATGTANVAIATATGSPRATGRIAIDASAFALSDTGVVPQVTFEWPAAAVLIAADPGNGTLSINLGGRLAGAGDATLSARIPAQTTEARIVSIDARELPAETLSPYAVEMIGRRLITGRIDVRLDYSGSRDSVDGQLRLSAHELEFAMSERDGIPLELFAALTEDANGNIAFNVPFAANARRVSVAVADALNARIAALTSAPLDTLSAFAAGDSGLTSEVPFLAGDAALNERALATISQLAALLHQRPKLGLRIHGSYAPGRDRDALATRQIELHVLLATAGPVAQARPEPVDFASPRVQDVLDEFAGERLTAQRREEIASGFNCETAATALCKPAYYAAVFDALVASETIANTALNRLARFRAQSIADALRRQGVVDERIEIVTGTPAIESPFGIGMAVEPMAARSNL